MSLDALATESIPANPQKRHDEEHENGGRQQQKNEHQKIAFMSVVHAGSLAGMNAKPNTFKFD